MTEPLPGFVHATAADLHGHGHRATASTRLAALARPVAGSGHIGRAAVSRACAPPGILLAATATRHHVNVLVVIGALAVLAAVWLVRAWLWPFAPCRRCKGSKTNIGSNRKRFGNCRRCGGSGARIRFGARTVHRALLRRKEPR